MALRNVLLAYSIKSTVALNCSCRNRRPCLFSPPPALPRLPPWYCLSPLQHLSNWCLRSMLASHLLPPCRRLFVSSSRSRPFVLVCRRKTRLTRFTTVRTDEGGVPQQSLELVIRSRSRHRRSQPRRHRGSQHRRRRRRRRRRLPRKSPRRKQSARWIGKLTRRGGR